MDPLEHSRVCCSAVTRERPFAGGLSATRIRVVRPEVSKKVPICIETPSQAQGVVAARSDGIDEPAPMPCAEHGRQTPKGRNRPALALRPCRKPVPMDTRARREGRRLRLQEAVAGGEALCRPRLPPSP